MIASASAARQYFHVHHLFKFYKKNAFEDGTTFIFQMQKNCLDFNQTFIDCSMKKETFLTVVLVMKLLSTVDPYPSMFLATVL